MIDKRGCDRIIDGLTKICLLMCLFFAAQVRPVAASSLDQKWAGDIDPEGIAPFMTYLHTYYKWMEANAGGYQNTTAPMVEKAKRKPFHSSALSAEAEKTYDELLDAWAPPPCEGQINSQGPVLKLVGESHPQPDCKLAKLRGVRKAARGETTLAMEGVFRDEKQNLDIFSGALLIKTSLVDKRVYGIEAKLLRNLMDFIDISLSLSDALRKQPKLISKPFSIETFKALAITDDYGLALTVENIRTSLLVFLNDDLGRAHEFISAIVAHTEISEGLQKLQATYPKWRELREAQGSTGEMLAAYLDKASRNLTFGELLDITKVISLEYLKLAGPNFIEDLNIPEALARKSMEQTAFWLKSGNTSAAWNITAGAYRDLVFASNIVGIYCASNLKIRKPLEVFTGEAHARAIQYLFQKNLPQLPVVSEFGAEKYALYLEKDTLRDLIEFLNGN